MQFKTFLLIVLFGTFFVGCQQEYLKDYMTNTWETTYLKIEMPTYQKSDSLEIYEDTFENIPERIAQSKYNADGTFKAWYLNKKGEKKDETDGKWSVKKDSLFIKYVYGGRTIKTRYHITKTKEGFLGKSLYDWDGDGEFDDVLTMKTKSIH